ncbi:MAG TPA: endonuclease V [Candidatus Bathyarchaeia archaeon]|nr:endonuclease V [Candidatus Bathyarchaeia archaeon]
MRIRIPAGISAQEAVTMQQRLAPLISEISELPTKITALVGCDATYLRGTTLAAAVLVDYENLQAMKVKTVKKPTRFPYIPGLLAFREAPAVLHAIRALRGTSYICMVDAHGLAHPRRFGLACFVGLALGRPTIGVAKSLLCGSVKGNHVLDEHDYPIAECITLPESGRTIYVSVGHKISLKDAVRIVKRCLTPRGPVPIKLAHEEVTNGKWRMAKQFSASLSRMSV